MAEEDEVRVEARVHPSQKDNWEDWLDEPDTPHSKMSDLIRAAVNTYISDNDSRSASRVDLSPALESLDGLDSRLNHIDDQLETLNERIGRDPTINHAADAIYQLLPTAKTDEELQERGKSAQGMDRRELVNYLGPLDSIAGELELEKVTAISAIGALQHQHPEVTETTVEGQVCYYIKESDTEEIKR
ncbi:hypothetical protein EXE43_05150 [Halorubrum sp. SS5]|nr:hypothetical protein EXE43_05150 [Halorubrum sp. SS5]